MKFRPVIHNNKTVKEAIESAEGYIILQCLADNKPTGRILAFHKISGHTSQPIGGYDSSADAKKACESHIGNCTCLSNIIPTETILAGLSR